jgi:acetolactate decarboxylase
MRTSHLLTWSFSMLRRMLWRVLVLAFFAPPVLPAQAAEAYQVSTISSLLAGGYDGDTTVGQMLRHGDFGLGTFNGVDGEMMVLDGRVYRATVDGRTHLVASTELTPFAVVVPFRPHTSMPVGTGESLDQFEAALDALPYSASRVLAVRVDSRFQAVQIRSEPKQSPPYRPLVEVIKTQQVVHTLDDVGHPDGISFSGCSEFGQCGRLALPFSQRRQDARRSRAWPDHRRRPGAGGRNLRPAHQLSRQRSSIRRQPGIDQGGGTAAVKAGSGTRWPKLAETCGKGKTPPRGRGGVFRGSAEASAPAEHPHKNSGSCLAFQFRSPAIFDWLDC